MNAMDPLRDSCRRIAIWIDRRTAILNTFVGGESEAAQLFHPEAGPPADHDGWSWRRIEAHRRELRKHFCDRVVLCLGTADEILILGPGLAKYELRRRIERHKGLRGKVVAVQNADTIPQVQLITISTPALDTARRHALPMANDLLSDRQEYGES
jgi:hypothetical protein